LICIVPLLELSAQTADISYSEPSLEHDTNYIETFSDFVTSRLYLSRKFTGIRLEETSEGNNLDFQPNTTLNLGIGATIKGFTLNLAYGFKFLNQNEERGVTRYLDLQSHLYGRKYAADLFGQFYFGMYMNNSEEILGFAPDSFYVRPDISVILLGGSYFRVHSPDKFSYAASLVQNEWQKKSAGSFLWGGKIVLMGASADTSFIPAFGNDTLFKVFDGVTQFSSFQFGPGVGYAHTFVLDKNWFFTFSLELNIMVASILYKVPALEAQSEWQVNPAADFKLALGYNSAKSYFGILYIQDNAHISSLDQTNDAVFSVGNVRLNYVQRFRMGPKLKKRIDKLPI
jgi:hypothetical protein